jgi:ribosomal protein S18 acetylase RimI-like enzyme
MVMDINIKKASKSEIGEILILVKGLYDNNYIPFVEDKVQSALEKLLDNESLGHVWTVYDNDAIVGYCIVSLIYSLEHEGRIAIIDEMYIKKSHRNQGYGKAILDTIEDFCREQGVHTVVLEVEKHNINAQVFFQIKGFQKMDRLTMIKNIP